VDDTANQERDHPALGGTIKVTLYGWNLIVLIDTRTKIPLAVKVVKINEHDTLWLRALVTQAGPNGWRLRS
jgi:hypothetical protein